ncbi:MAG: MotA/TolQ/ExbB proton channel family protein [Firmicutes bacterium]|nr:MotA/TolQ/ExbB proton channel family protein [Bacillota bacterium]
MENPISGVISFLNKGGLVMYILVISSVVLIGLIMERFYFFWKSASDHDWFIQHMANYIQQGKISEALALLQQSDGPLPRTFEASLIRFDREKHEIEEAANNTIAEERLGMEKSLAIIGTMAVVAPFIGLFGTVVGIMHAFESIALKGGTGPEVVAKGVAEALITTAAGLFVAIVAVVFFNFFNGKVKNIVQRLTISSTKLNEIISYAKQEKATAAAAAAKKVAVDETGQYAVKGPITEQA